MRTLLIGYDLNAAGQNYDNLITSIKAIGAWWHYLDSTWLVKTAQTATAVRDNLAHHIDGNDELLVIDVTQDPAAWAGFDSKASSWLSTNL